MWANITKLNKLRVQRGLNTFSFRPHGGEAGDLDHLASNFLLANSSNHGIKLYNSVVLQYLFYLKQIGLSVSPLSNNILFVKYEENPFLKFFKRGLNVTLSTDDPLLIHFSKNALMEEYSIAAQVYKLSNVDLCEIARNSVLQCGWSRELKQQWLGHKEFDQWQDIGSEVNDIYLTNVPDIRVDFRKELLVDEILFVHSNGNPRIQAIRRGVTSRLLTPFNSDANANDFQDTDDEQALCASAADVFVQSRLDVLKKVPLDIINEQSKARLSTSNLKSADEVVGDDRFWKGIMAEAIKEDNEEEVDLNLIGKNVMTPYGIGIIKEITNGNRSYYVEFLSMMCLINAKNCICIEDNININVDKKSAEIKTDEINDDGGDESEIETENEAESVDAAADDVSNIFKSERMNEYVLQLKLCAKEDLETVIRLELANYPSDEAATPERLYYRFIFANKYFWVMKNYLNNEIIGFVVGTLVMDSKLTDESMGNHDPNGKHLCIHSVVIDEQYHRNGFGLIMVKKYVNQIIKMNIKEQIGLETIRLISKLHITPFYKKNGFELIGESDIEHGKDTWYEMVYKLST